MDEEGQPAAGGAALLPGFRGLSIAEPTSEAEEDLPTHLDESRGGRYAIVSADKLSAEYIGLAQHGRDVGAVQANRPAPRQRLLYYFEIIVEDRGRRGTIAIGFTDGNFPLTRQPGWEPGSYGYHGDDGMLYRSGRGRVERFGPTFSTGDSVGAGINYAAHEMFFTKNGRLVGRTAFEDSEGPFYPTVGLHSQSEKVSVNFGQRPFVFDVVVLEDRERRQRSVESVPVPLWRSRIGSREGIANMNRGQRIPATTVTEERTHMAGLRLEDDLPTHLNKSTCGRNCNVSDDRLSVKYTKIERRGGYDVGAVHGNCSVPQRRLLYYFEITVKDRGRRGAIAIGFSGENFPMNLQPGWEPGSYGYHGDDGRLFHGRGMVDPFGPTFSTGDTVGAGINYAAQEMFFTKNGQVVGKTILQDTEEPWYPTIGLHSCNEKVAVNFGQRPFVFDVVVQDDRERQQRSVESVTQAEICNFLT